MKVKPLVVQQVLNKQHPITEDDGDKLYTEIRRIKDSGNIVLIDFTGITGLTTAVINNSISKFVIEDGIDLVSTYLKITGQLDDTMKNIINMSLSLAQLKYQSNHNSK